jgi:hypothetical protein
LIVKLHLGCGRHYFPGYLNIDYPPSEQTVQSDLVADQFDDITKLSYPKSSVREIRLHHVFEHFSRSVALALLCRWRDWLEPGGLLRIETPDVMASVKLLTSPFYSFDNKQQVMRHLFGSHEARWAFHCDGWYKDKFSMTLTKLGFHKLAFASNKWGMLRNIEVCAYKTENDFTYDYLRGVVRELLTYSTIRVSCSDKRSLKGSELKMLNVWIDMWEEAYRCDNSQMGYESFHEADRISSKG